MRDRRTQICHLTWLSEERYRGYTTAAFRSGQANKRLTIMLILAGLALSGCGTTTGDRGLSGAAIGASAGAVGAALLGGPVALVALVSGAAGAVTGAAASPSAVDLGKPVWEH
jgi:osmotically inducible lipoprotein OsmB